MSRVRFALCALLVWSAGCGSDGDAPPSFATEKPRFFQGLNLLADETRTAFPSFEKRWDAIAQDTIARLENGEIVEEKEQKQAAAALLYASFALVVGQHAIEDGYLKQTDLTRPPRYSKGDDIDEQKARMVKASEWLRRAAELDPTDERIPAVMRSCAFNVQTIDGTFTADVLLGLNGAASQSWFDTFTAILLLRDPNLHPGYAPQIEQLITIACGSSRFNCGGGGPAPEPATGERWLTKEVTGPLLMSDLLARRGESQLHRADLNPAMAGVLVPEAVMRIKGAEAFLAAAKKAAADPALAHFPATSRLAERSDRMAALLAAATGRQGGGTGPALPDPNYYKGRAYLDAYQCVACHTAGPTTQSLPR